MELLLSIQIRGVDWPDAAEKVGPSIQNPRHNQLAILLSHHTPWQRLLFAFLRDRLVSLFTLLPSLCVVGRVVAPLRRSCCLGHAPKPSPPPEKHCIPHLHPANSFATLARRVQALLEAYCTDENAVPRC
jgi:hypothetical protein